MENTFWLKQTADKPLFPDLLWSRPENRHSAGKLLIVGGHQGGFSNVAAAYKLALEAGAGYVRLILPANLQKTVGDHLPDVTFAPDTASGSFSRQALSELLEQSEWADGVLLAGDFGRNSETAVLVESFVSCVKKPLVVSHDAVDFFTGNSHISSPLTPVCFVLSLSQLQKLAGNLRFSQAISSSLDLMHFVNRLYELSRQFPFIILTAHQTHLLVAHNGRVSITPQNHSSDSWSGQVAAVTIVWWMQNPGKPFEAITTSLI